jgi:hypothetical protein
MRIEAIAGANSSRKSMAVALFWSIILMSFAIFCQKML